MHVIPMMVQVGMGPRSSAIVGGTTTMHRELELELADLKGTEDALLFPTGENLTARSHQRDPTSEITPERYHQRDHTREISPTRSNQ